MKLKDFLRNNKIKGEIFAENTGITHRTLMNVLIGKDISLNTAKKIVKSTHQAVTIDELGLDEENNHAENESKQQQQQYDAASNTPVILDQTG